MFPVKGLFLLALPLSLIACATPLPDETYLAMKRASCEGDMADFFLRVDRARYLAEFSAARRLKRPRASDEELRAEFEAQFHSWQEDVLRREASSTCRSKLESVKVELIPVPEGKPAKRAALTLRFDDGTMRYWVFYFDRKQNEWVLYTRLPE